MSAVPAQATAPFPAPSRAWWMIAVFSFTALVSYTDRLILNQLVDPIRHDLAIDDVQVSFLQGAAFAVIYVLAGLPLGRMADRIHRLNVIRAGAAVWSLGTIACAFAPSFWTLFAGRLAVGIGEAALAPAVVSIIGDSFPPARRGTALGAFLTSAVVGVSGAIAIGGWLLQAARSGWFAGWPVLGTLAPWRQVLLLVGLPGAAVLLLIATLREPARRELADGGSLRDAVRWFVTDRARLAPLYLGMGIFSIGDFAVLTWLPALLTRRYGLDAGEVGTLFGAIIAVTGIIGSMSGGLIADWAERRGGARLRLRIVMIGTACALPGVALLDAGSPTLTLAAVTLWALCSSVLGVTSIATLQELLPNQLRGVGTSLVSFCNILLGLGLGPSLTALVTEHVFGDPAAVGLAIVTVSLPTSCAAILLFSRSHAAIRKAAA